MRRIAILLVAALGAAAGVLGGPGASAMREAGAGARVDATPACEELLAHLREEALRHAPWGLPGNRIEVVHGTPPSPSPSPPSGSTVIGGPAGGAAGPPAGIPAPTYSGTNVQEVGVDEPDVVKTDGRTIFAVAGQTLRAVDVTGPRPRVVATLPLEGARHELLLHGRRLVVVSVLPDAIPLSHALPRYATGTTVVTEVDVTKPSAPIVAARLTLAGDYRTARLSGGVARLVVRSATPRGLVLFAPGRWADPRHVAELNRATLAAAPLESWLASYTLEDRRAGTTTTRSLLDCDDVRRPEEPAGLGLLTIVTLDLDRGVAPVDADALATDSGLAYASKTSLYLATDPVAMRRPAAPATTTVHRFDTSTRAETRYRASGTVPGHLLNQWSLSEHKGVLRVVSSEWPSGAANGRSGPPPDNFVSLLRERAGELVTVGRLDDIGRGEEVKAVRFIGETAYVVTFYVVDPLFVLDLSRPERPKRAGELKIPGYSAYLHPLGKDLLVGIGQDVSHFGEVRGTQISIFDVADPRQPLRLDKHTVANAASEAENEHHAFLHWPATRLAVVPIRVYEGPSWQSHRPLKFAGVAGFRLTAENGIELLGNTAHGKVSAANLDRHVGTPIDRSLVVGDTVYTLSSGGVSANDAHTFAQRAWTAFR